MTEKEIIRILLDRSRQSLFEMSVNYLMTVPKAGCRADFATEKEIIDYLEMLQNSMVATN